jgi:hypothetical protein
MLVLSLCNYEAGGKSEAEFTCPDKRGAESTPYIAFVRLPPRAARHIIATRRPRSNDPSSR